ncbi:Ecm11p Ecym_4097 [Eremothecium cymbalariae DBVPG|uniref:Extracellular mutant protein 11 C-terminal domain-containing protein n=1 Tax=Eremothecium cymbalariae (strain CBS 270.75 / DBVPG 7215 / KCTC 17166 / NRRL Y-17582) TaxID=931890 RepID=G8JT23_ERECY|nr:hypothetical protein Ecym_4097 [Eremothecium cymbalariae DBVPG\
MTVFKQEPGTGEIVLPSSCVDSVKEVQLIKTNSQRVNNRPEKQGEHGVQKVHKPAVNLHEDERKKDKLSKFLLKQPIVKQESVLISFQDTSPSSRSAEAVSKASGSVGPKKQGKEEAGGGGEAEEAAKVSQGSAGLLSDSILFTDACRPSKLKNTGSKGCHEPKKDPGSFQAIEQLLYEYDKSQENSENYEEVFGQVEEPTEYARVATLDFQKWAETGQEILKEHQELMAKMVANRAKLSYKFQVITQVINERAEVLMKQGTQFQEKLERIQTLGREILDII